MTHQPLLSGFPTTVLATAKRRLQAAIRNASAIVSQRSLSGYAVLFRFVLPGEFLQGIDPTSRQRCFGHLPVFWAWLAQILEANASCQKAVSWIQCWCRASHLPVPASHTASYCKARARIRLSFLHAIHKKITEQLSWSVSEGHKWAGFTLKAMDGSSVQLMDTAANQSTFPQPSGQKPGCAFPVMGIVGLVNLAHGGWEHFVDCPHVTHDSKAAIDLIDHLQQGDLLLADRAFCTYELIARSLQRGSHTLMRLHQARAKALNWSDGKRISRHERLVTWKRPQRPPGTTLDAQTWNALPATLEVRLIKLGYEKRGGEKGELILVTTLTDPKNHCGIELADLYARRWDIELKLRDLKTTLAMECFLVKSPALARKTLWMSVIAYNLVRSLMQRSAATEHRPAWHLSFKGVLDTLVSSHERFRLLASKPRKYANELKELLTLCMSRLIRHRPHRQEPRVRKRRSKNYALLTAPRVEYEEIQHRNRYRKPA